VGLQGRETVWSAWTNNNQISQGLRQSDEEDELYEEVEDMRNQHSQFTTLYHLIYPTHEQSLKPILHHKVSRVHAYAFFGVQEKVNKQHTGDN
jgi:hypothetical protein